MRWSMPASAWWLDNLTTGFDWAVAKGASLVIGETGDQPRVAALIVEHRVDAVIHFAASIIVPDSVRDPLGYYRNNTVNSRALIETVVKAGVRHFIFSSTAAVYGNPERVPVREDDPTVPTSPYGSSKLMTEIMLRDAGATHDLGYVILRYFNVAGADPLGRTGQSTREATHLIKVAVETALGLRPKMDLFGTDCPTPDGTCIRDYIHVSNLVRAHFRCSRLRRRIGDTQLRLWPWLFRARCDRDGEARVQRRLQGRTRGPAGGRSDAHRRGLRPCSCYTQLAAAFRRSADHRHARAGLGAQTCNARQLTMQARRLRLKTAAAFVRSGL
jgi:nucleoside-diphosphate-sugar epimerase